MNKILCIAIVVAIASTLNGCRDRDNPTNGSNTNTGGRIDTLTLCAFELHHVRLSGDVQNEVNQDIDLSFKYRIRRSGDTLLCDTSYYQSLINAGADSAMKRHQLRILIDTVSFTIGEFSYMVASHFSIAVNPDYFIDTLFLSGGGLKSSAQTPFQYGATGNDQMISCMNETFYERYFFHYMWDPTKSSYEYVLYLWRAGTIECSSASMLTIKLTNH